MKHVILCHIFLFNISVKTTLFVVELNIFTEKLHKNVKLFHLKNTLYYILNFIVKISVKK